GDEQVEGRAAKFQQLALGEVEVSRQGEVEVGQARPDQDAAARVTERRLAGRRLGSDESAGVEPAINRTLLVIQPPVSNTIGLRRGEGADEASVLARRH